MPELPEVETTLRGVEPFLANATVDAMIVREPRLRWPVPDDLAARIEGQQVVGLRRRAKYLLVDFEQGSVIVHLGMSGNLRVVDKSTPLKKHDHVDMVLSSGKVVRFNDPRRFGCVLWQDKGTEHERLLGLGPEPLTEDFNAEGLAKAAKNSSRPIKQLIMDNKVVVGVGNIYANEALFKAGIRPTRPANKISKARLTSLTDEIKVVLAKAIAQGGTTLKDFVGSDGKPGYFQQTLQVYGRAGQPCSQCTTLLKEVRMSGRATVFCPECQR
ncbi:MAG: bifunctional DNA-formamidopyrimidine glycosylase/DNA-(apurinic or apyrimidinic site) lyase [Pontibacterium sp.]